MILSLFCGWRMGLTPQDDCHRDESALLMKTIFKIFSDFIWAKNASANGHHARRPRKFELKYRRAVEWEFW